LIADDGHPVEAPLCRLKVARTRSRRRSRSRASGWSRAAARADRSARSETAASARVRRPPAVRPARRHRRRSRSPRARRRRSSGSPSSARRWTRRSPHATRTRGSHSSQGWATNPRCSRTSSCSLRARCRWPSPVHRRGRGGVAEPGGRYSVYTAPVFPDDPAATVTRS